jgi:hypothetical protein
MRTLYGDVAMIENRLEDLPLLAPQELTKAVAHPTDWIADIWVLRWIEQFGEAAHADGDVKVKLYDQCRADDLVCDRSPIPSMHANDPTSALETAPQSADRMGIALPSDDSCVRRSLCTDGG